MVKIKKVFIILLCHLLIISLLACQNDIKPLPIDDTVKEMMAKLNFTDCYITDICNYLKHKNISAAVSDDEIEEIMRNSISRYPSENIVNKTIIEKGDLVKISYEIFNQSSSVIKVDNQVVCVGKINFDTIIEQSIEGKKVGKTYTIEYTNSSAGLINTTCDITPLYIYSLSEPEINDSFVRTHFNYNSIEEWKTAIKNDLEEEKKSTVWSETIDSIITECSFDLNDDCILEHTTTLAYQTAMQATLENLTLDTYIMQTMNMSKEEFYDICYKTCQKEVQEYLIIGAIATIENITVSDQEIDQYCKTQNLDKNDLHDEEEIYLYYYVLRDKVQNLLCS